MLSEHLHIMPKILTLYFHHKTVWFQVWVMGEHPDDKSIESILAEEAREKAIAQARQEVQQLRKSVEKELTQLIEYKPLDDLEQVRILLYRSSVITRLIRNFESVPYEILRR